MTKTAPERDEIAGIVDFLCGAAPDWQGRWFDEASRQERGSFWWRTYVRQIERIAAKDRAEALAAQGALLEKAAKVALNRQGRRMCGSGQNNSFYDIGCSDAASAIRALSPDANAALEHVRREAVEQGRAEAADEIERLRAALREYMEHDEDYTRINRLGDHTKSHRWKRARAALAQEGE